MCGISETQFYNRIRADDFKRLFSSVKTQILERATTTMQSGMDEAARTMIQIMRDEMIAPQTRLNAAEGVIRNGMRLTEQLEIVQRIERLEAKYGE